MITDIYELSPMQRGMLSHALLAPGSTAYGNQFGCTLRGDLDPERLRRAWQHLVDRHPTLRTSFHWEKLDKPLQVVRDAVVLPWRYEDWSGLDRDAVRGRWEEHLARDREAGFRLDRAPLMRCMLARIDAGEHRLSCMHHHLLMDGWCLSIILDELFRAYAAEAQGEVPRLGPVRPFRDYILWLQARDAARDREFWTRDLAGFRGPTPLQLQIVENSALRRAAAGAVASALLPDDFCLKLREFASRHQLTPSLLFQGAWAILLARYGGEADVAYGLTVSGRPPECPDLEAVVGPFINTVPVRVRVEGDSPLVDWLRGLQERQAARGPHDHAAIFDIQKWAGVSGDTPLFDSLMIFMNYPYREPHALAESGLEIADVQVYDRTEMPLTIQVTPAGRWEIEFLYDPGRFEAATIGRMLGHLRTLLEGFVDHPGRPVGQFPIVTEPERRRLLDAFNDTVVEFDRDRTFARRFEEVAAVHPDRSAVRCEGRSLSFRELNERANRLARGLLRRSPLGPDDLVAILARRSERMMEAILAIWKCGAAYVPIDPDDPDGRIVGLIEDSRCRLVIVDGGSARPGLMADPAIAARLFNLDEVPLEAEGHDDLGRLARPGDLAYVIFTSGSTGKPKGAMVEHRGMLNHLLAKVHDFAIGPESVVAQNASHCFDVSAWQFFAAPLAGGRTVIYGNDLVLDPDAFLDRIEADGVTLLEVVPSYLSALLDRVGGRDKLAARLKLMVVTGEVVKPTLLGRWFRAFPGVPVVNAYGPTEASDDITHFFMDRVPDSQVVPVGTPIQNTRIYVVDEWLNLCPVGIKGEVCVSGDGVGRGYLDDEAKTRAAFLEDPFRPGQAARMYRTGDVGRLREDGTLLLLGRKDHQVKVRGHRIELGEVEAALARLGPVRDAVVLDRDDDGRDTYLCGYVTLHDAAEVSGEEVARMAAERLPAYMAPAVVVVIDRLPLTANGKVDRKALPAPDPSRRPVESGYVAPRTGAEEILCEAWGKALGIPDPGIHDNFFALGGDSIIGMQVVARVARAGLRLSPGQVFEHPTVASLAPLATPIAPATTRRKPASGPLPLTPIQSRFLGGDPDEANHYNQSILLDVPTDLDPARLGEALRHVADHHDALRLRFRVVAGRWRQEAATGPIDVPLHVEILAGNPAVAIETAASKLHAGLDLAAGPLVRAGLFRLEAGQGSRLLLVAHHLVVDGVSWRILIEDIHRAYEQLERGEPVQRPRATSSFASWALGLSEYGRAGMAADRPGFWLEPPRFPVKPLPVDHEVAEGSNLARFVEEISVGLDEASTVALLKVAPRAYGTRIDDLLLAALTLAFRDWTREPRMLVDLEGHGREHPTGDLDVSRTVGWFTAIYPVLLESTDDSPREAIVSVKERLRQVSGRGLEYGILRYLSDSDDPAHRAALESLPAAEVLFNYLGQTDSAAMDMEGWRLAAEPTGDGRGPNRRRDHLLEVNAYVAAGRLHVIWSFSKRVHDRTTVRSLAERYAARLTELIEHCVDPAISEFTPSDFPAARASRATLESLMLRLRAQDSRPVRESVDDVYELVPTQQGMLFHELYESDSGAYFNQLTCRIEGALDVAAFHSACREVVGRHPALRTSFHWEGLEKPLQVVHRRVELPWWFEDLSDRPPADAREAWERLMAADRHRGFDLDRPPLIRAYLARFGETDWRFGWSQHHILLDGWSSSRVLAEVVRIYEATCDGRPPGLATPRPFRDKLTWLQQQDRSEAMPFWRSRLAGFGTPTALPVGLPEMEGSRHPGGRAEEEVELPEATSTRLIALAQAGHVTLNTLAQVAWAILLGRYGGEADVVYGTVVAGRPPALDGVDEMIGVFINTVPVRVRLDPDLSVLSLAKTLQAELSQVEQHAECPLADIQRGSDVPGGAPLFETLLIFENYPVEDSLREGSRRLKFHDVHAFEPNNYPITLVVTPARGLSLKVVYDDGRFDRATALRLLGHYRRVLEQLLAAPDAPIANIGLLTGPERDQILTEWNDTTSPIPEGRTIVDLFEERATSDPRRPAVRCGEVSRTYGELSERSDQLANWLIESAGIEPEDRVAVLVPRSDRMVACLFAIWKLGAAYVPIDPGYPTDRIRLIIEGARPRVVLTGRTSLSIDAASSIPDGIPVLDLDSPGEWPTAGTRGKAAIRCRPESLAYVIFTSGSTGKPKGAMVEHRGMLNHILGMIDHAGLDESSVVAQTASHCFDISVWQFFAALLVGGQTVIYSDETILSPDTFAARLSDDGVTTLQMVPSYLNTFLDAFERDGSPYRLERLRSLVLIGEVLKPSAVRRWFALRPRTRMINAYGPTEASDSVTHFVMERPPSLASVPIGRPIPNMRVYVLDRHGNLCPIGVVGEICVSGIGVGRGYLFDQDRTHAAFAEDSFREERGVRLYRTGDIGCFAPDGNLLFFGRTDHQVKIRGHRIELGEVEAVLCRVQGVRDAVVLDREDAAGARFLCAYVTPVERDCPSPADLKDSLRGTLPAFMIPDVLTILPELPLTPNGKVDRKALPGPAVGAGSNAPEPEAAPSTATELAVARIWREVLGSRTFGVDDHFFDIGGHSLSAILAISRVRRDLSAEATLGDLFAFDTIRTLSEHLDKLTKRAIAEIPVLPPRRWYEVSHTQKRIWLSSRTPEGSLAYNIAVGFRIEGDLDRGALHKALEAVVARHESLRTVFALVEGELSQAISPPDARPMPFAQVDLRDHPDPSSEAARRARDEFALPFDLGRGPLFRSSLLRIGERSHSLMMTLHHAIADAWSIRVLFGELMRAYAAFKGGLPGPLPTLPIQYKDFAAWHNELLGTGALDATRDYWLRALSADMPRLMLPTDHPRPDRPSYQGGRVAFEPDREVVRGLRALGRAHGTSLFGALLAAINVLLHRYTGQEDVVIGSQAAGRFHESLEGQVGAYLNTVVLRNRMKGNSTLAEVVSSVGSVLREALENQAYPFDLLLEDLKVRTPPGRAPLFDVLVDSIPYFGDADGDEAPTGLSIVDASADEIWAKYDLTFLAVDDPSGSLLVTLVYNAALFRRETVEGMRDRLAEILHSCLRDPGQRVEDIPLLATGAPSEGSRVRVKLRL